jgi:3-hydroxymyristoyl/3-hydroxydecanoyl-(acyl carrier protein) dehydratase
VATAAQLNASARFQIGPDHPALPGHFPGAPVVPGVLLLAEGLQQLAAQCGRSLACRRVEHAKFLLPVAPGDTIIATLHLDAAGRGSLNLHVGKSLVAQATLLILLPDSESARA